MTVLDPAARTGADAALRWASMPMIWDWKVSPDGRQVAWSWSGTGEGFDIYVAPTDGSAAPTRLTRSSQFAMPRGWSPDGRALILGIPTDGDDRERLYRLPIDRPDGMTLLTDAAPDYFTIGGEMHENGRWLVYAASRDPETGGASELHALYRHDLETGERRVLARYRLGDEAAPEIDRDGRTVLYHRAAATAGGIELWLADLDGTADRRLLSLGDRTRIAGSWMPDGKAVLFLASSDTHERVGLCHLPEGRVEWLVDDAARFVERALPDRDGRGIMLVEIEDARLRACWLDLATRSETPIAAQSGTLMPLAPLPGGDWIGLAYSSTQPHELVRFSVAARGRDARRLSRTAVIPPTPPLSFAAAGDYRWRSADGLPVQGWLYRPQGAAKGTVIWVHGGPTWHSEDEANAAIQYLVGEGFAMLDVNYRGSTGFGTAYREAIKIDGWGGREQADIRAGIEALIADGIAARGRIGIIGVSYGGYSSWFAATRWPDLIAAAVPICGMTDLAIDYAATHMPHGRLYSEEMMGGTPAAAAERYRERSPIHAVGNIRGRLLVVHGLTDTNVSPANTEHGCKALEAAGIPYELLTYPDEGHGVWKRGNRADLFRRVGRFFDEALAGRA